MKSKTLKDGGSGFIRTEEQYHRMVEEVEDYAILMLDAHGFIVNWNRGAQKIKGYTEEEIVGRHFSVFYTAADQAAGLPGILMEKARQEGKAIHEGWRVRKDGTSFWGSIVITALHDADNRVVGFSKVTRDLTERKMWEDKLRQYTRQLETQNAELQQFAHMAAHDMKEPLRKIQYYQSMILEENISEEKTKDFLTRSAEAASRMQGLIEDLLAFTRIAEPVESLETIDLNEIVADVWQFFRDTTDRIHAELSVEKLPVIHAIPFQVSQLFSNLISNSIKYHAPDHPLRISITAGICGPPGNVPLATGRFHKISITDNGIGFDQTQAGRIFAMFERLHRRDQYPGTGIGLAICRKVMENHKGFILAHGIPDQGATFELYFPF
jgi:PAS domain S-box-containing protein